MIYEAADSPLQNPAICVDACILPTSKPYEVSFRPLEKLQAVQYGQHAMFVILVSSWIRTFVVQLSSFMRKTRSGDGASLDEIMRSLSEESILQECIYIMAVAGKLVNISHTQHS